MSKQSILEAIKKGLKGNGEKAGDACVLDDQIRKEMGKLAPVKLEDLILQFERELRLVDGEFFQDIEIQQVAHKVEGILGIKKCNQLATTDQNLCAKVCLHLRKLPSNPKVIIPDQIDPANKYDIISKIPVALVQASYGVADIGALVFIYEESRTTLPHFLAETVVALLDPNKIVANLHELFSRIKKEAHGDMVIVTGPSRTADIEKVLVLGAHGPKKLLVCLVT